jgi:hypothetical protein
VSCDNASNNEKMADEMEHLLPAFSSGNRVRCFTHVLNLIAKALLKQFEMAKKSENEDDDFTEEEAKLLTLAENLDEEEFTMAEEKMDENGGADEEDSMDEWVDEVDALTPNERLLLEDEIRPVKMVLVKVSPCHR